MNKSIELATTTGLLMTTDRYNEFIAESEHLKAKMAVQAEALKDLYAQIQTFAINFGEADFYTGDALKALNATQADVDNWMQGKKAEWEKGVLEEVITLEQPDDNNCHVVWSENIYEMIRAREV